MAISVSPGQWPSAFVLICIFLSAWQTGIAQNPQTAAAGVLSNQYIPGSGGVSSNNQYQPGIAGSFGNQYQPGNGNVYADPDHIISKALLCFDDKKIYGSCNEAYRLSVSGDLHVPLGFADEYCAGPCLSETQYVLSCLEGVMSSFKFYNEATIEDIKETLKEGCAYGATRGDFNVAEHIQANNYSNAQKTCNLLFLHGLLLLMTVWFLLI